MANEGDIQEELLMRMGQVMLEGNVNDLWTPKRLTLVLAERGWLPEDGSTSDAALVGSLLNSSYGFNDFGGLLRRGHRYALTTKARTALPEHLRTFWRSKRVEPSRTSWDRLLEGEF